MATVTLELVQGVSHTYADEATTALTALFFFLIPICPDLGDRTIFKEVFI